MKIMIEVHYMSNMLTLYSTYTHTKQTHTHALVFEMSLRRIKKQKTWKTYTYDYFKNLTNNKKKIFGHKASNI